MAGDAVGESERSGAYLGLRRIPFMYGLIYQAIRSCIVKAHGESAWSRIARAADVSGDQFVSMQAYPDELAFRLVEAVGHELQWEQADVLRMIGKHWVLETASTEFGPLFDFAGDDLVTVLGNLDAMHNQVAISFDNIKQPSFAVERESEGSVLLRYRSVRDGLAPFVMGLLDGLSEHFDEPIQVELIEAKQANSGADVFRILMHA